MSSRIPSQRFQLQRKSVETSVKSLSFRRHSKPFTMIEDSIDDHLLNGGREQTYRKLKRLIRLCGGSCNWAKRRIAAHLNMKLGTYNDHRRGLEDVGLITVERRRQGGCRQNDTNILRLGEGGLKIQPQKHTEKNLTTTTPAPDAARVGNITPKVQEPTPQRVQWEARQAQDREDHRRMRVRYEEKGHVIERGRGHRLQRAYERNRLALAACVGVYMGDKSYNDEGLGVEDEKHIAEVRRKEREGRELYAKRLGRVSE